MPPEGGRGREARKLLSLLPLIPSYGERGGGSTLEEVETRHGGWQEGRKGPLPVGRLEGGGCFFSFVLDRIFDRPLKSYSISKNIPQFFFHQKHALNAEKKEDGPDKKMKRREEMDSGLSLLFHYDSHQKTFFVGKRRYVICDVRYFVREQVSPPPPPSIDLSRCEGGFFSWRGGIQMHHLVSLEKMKASRRRWKK